MTGPFAYRESYTNAELGKYIKKYWVLDNSLNSQALVNKSVVPNGSFNIAFISGGGIAITHHGYTQTTLKEGVYLCGQLKSSVEICLNPYSKITLVQLYPWTVAMFSNFPQQQSANQYIPLEEINTQLCRNLKGVDFYDEAYIIDFFQQKFGAFLQKNTSSYIVEEVSSLIKNSKGEINIREIAKSLRCSTRLIEKKFNLSVGMSPKEFSTIIKIRNLISSLAQKQTPQSMAQLALEYGFYDQAHFIKTFKKIAQISPGKFEAGKYLLALQDT